MEVSQDFLKESRYLPAKRLYDDDVAHFHIIVRNDVTVSDTRLSRRHANTDEVNEQSRGLEAKGLRAWMERTRVGSGVFPPW